MCGCVCAIGKGRDAGNESTARRVWRREEGKGKGVDWRKLTAQNLTVQKVIGHEFNELKF